MIRREADTFHSMLRPAPESVRGVAIGWCSCRVRAQKALCYNSQTDSQMPLARVLRMIVGSALFAGHGARAQRQLTEMRPDASQQHLERRRRRHEPVALGRKIRQSVS